MKLTDIFINRPVMTALLMIGIVLFGAAGYRSLPVSDLPNVDFPTIQVSAGLPGASPETMAASVATTLERQFATISGIDSMTSSSGIGSTSITIQFTLDRSIDAAAQDVQNAISAALSPETMAASVATTLERQFATISGIDSMTSSSGIGSTSITIQFTLDRSIDAAAQDVQNAI